VPRAPCAWVQLHHVPADHVGSGDNGCGVLKILDLIGGKQGGRQTHQSTFDRRKPHLDIRQG